MKKLVNGILAVVMILLFALFNGCTMSSPEDSTPEQEDLTIPEDKLPRWLLWDHQSTENNDLEIDLEIDNENILVETNNDEDKTESVSEPFTDPEPDPEIDSHADKPTPDKQQDPVPENEDSDSVELSPSEKREINRAKEALKEIEKDYRTASSEEKVELASRYNYIINQLKSKYGITHDHKLDETEWWKLDRDASSSFQHEVHTKID